MPPISKHTKLTLVLSPLTSGSSTTDQASDPVDMTGFEGVRFLTTVGLTTGAGCGITAQASTSTTVGDFASFTTSITANSTVANRMVALDVYKPTKRYIRVICNSTVLQDMGGVIAEQYGAAVSPTSNSSSVQGESFGIST